MGADMSSASRHIERAQHKSDKTCHGAMQAGRGLSAEPGGSHASMAQPKLPPRMLASISEDPASGVLWDLMTLMNLMYYASFFPNPAKRVLNRNN